MRKQVDHSHYTDGLYDTRERFLSYWTQIELIAQAGAQSVLEIGVGVGLVNYYLKKTGISVTSMDIDPDLGTDLVGSVTDIPLEDNSVDFALCCQVLEHLPYDQFVNAVSELKRVARLGIVLSLPDVTGLVFAGSFRLPKFGMLQGMLTLPRLRPIENKFDGQHYWEIGKRGFPVDRILASIGETGINVERHFRLKDNPYHRFFVLRQA
ncbi:MAG: class I SAM-dependent methyltransferase [Pseudomonadota bacterium]